ncbi:Ham1 protein [Alcanivorax sp. MD8A]|uniref:dITP/XTP pyrophosphatase n=1 Tax=Alcanivorax profundi TaxID=2338368 RepID=A0A418XZ56_9GAMM|nr:MULTISPECIES: RdgB/HAM1 family non-canonical purine NTP pyrophosphatase [Alcanivorax]ERP89257.1 NTP phosphatase [Alcanivorax sp. P2S70]PNE04128.1 Ham1 protein [Alcanivorax sp. MD8A]RJG18310.1 RdgB/HAM1 family non-canonical purine NTP pyrophosphatase [Alcanivorax profundi]|tara:strand:+ start:349 stop:945 length:597 start_codon:yes stop_codon:yes gene_type:complete
MEKLVLASGNKKKLAELQGLLSPLNIEVVPQSEFDVPEADETGTTFVENAIIKARNACKHTGLPAIADDSGIEIDALRGAPGVFSARFAGVGATDAKNNKLMVELLSDLPDVNRGARYVAVLALMEHEDDATPILCQGTWDGEIVLEPQGEQGFGYDPHFFVPEKGCTAAQLDPQEKNALSHRGKAMAALLTQLKREP